MKEPLKESRAMGTIFPNAVSVKVDNRRRISVIKRTSGDNSLVIEFKKVLEKGELVKLPEPRIEHNCLITAFIISREAAYILQDALRTYLSNIPEDDPNAGRFEI